MNMGWFWLRPLISLSKGFSLISKSICFNLFSRLPLFLAVFSKSCWLKFVSVTRKIVKNNRCCRNATLEWQIKSCADKLRDECRNHVFGLFQIFFTAIHNGQKKTPLHVSLCETIHDTCRSKKLIQILNRMRLCMSYDELEKIDVCSAEKSNCSFRALSYTGILNN